MLLTHILPVPRSLPALRILLVLGATLALGACVAGPASNPVAMVSPGSDRTAAEFQQDQAVCQQHAAAQTGYGTPAAPAPASLAGSPTGAAAAPAQRTDDVSFMQCMAARGDSVQIVAMGDQGAYAPPYAYDYPGAGFYPYGFPGYNLAFGGVGFFHGGNLHHDFFHHHDFHGGGFHGGGFHGRDFHGGGFHGGHH
jgi:hypothetical protein